MRRASLRDTAHLGERPRSLIEKVDLRRLRPRLVSTGFQRIFESFQQGIAEQNKAFPPFRVAHAKSRVCRGYASWRMGGSPAESPVCTAQGAFGMRRSPFSNLGAGPFSGMCRTSYRDAPCPSRHVLATFVDNATRSRGVRVPCLGALARTSTTQSANPVSPRTHFFAFSRKFVPSGC